MEMSVAQLNFKTLGASTYPGRGIVVGIDETGKYAVQVYWIMGRSENSQNRVFGYSGGRLFTEAADPTKVKDPSLIIYNAMDEKDGIFVVSNGCQTDTMIGMIRDDGSSNCEHAFIDAMFAHDHEPDAPNFTPRITALAHVLDGKCYTAMAMLRKSRWDDTCDRHFYYFKEIAPGFGYCLTTYSGDGNPLPAFQGEPYILPLMGDVDVTSRAFWSALNPAYRVSLAVKFINISSGKSQLCIVNRFKKVD